MKKHSLVAFHPKGDPKKLRKGRVVDLNEKPEAVKIAAKGRSGFGRRRWMPPTWIERVEKDFVPGTILNP